MSAAEPPESERLVTLVLNVGADPISGRIVDGEPFTGWVQLAAALDALSRDDGAERVGYAATRSALDGSASATPPRGTRD